MSEPSDADKIRLKRLAKLQQQAEEQQRQQQEQQAATAEQKQSASSATVPKSPLQQQQQQQQPSPQVKKQPNVEITRPITLTSPAKSSPQPTGSPVPQQQQEQQSKVAPAKSFEDWQNEVLSRILQVTLSLDTVYKQGRCVYLHGLVTELEDENAPQPYRLSQALLDRILVARLSIDPNESNDEYPEDVRNDLKVLHFDYLLACWKRAHDIKRNTLTRSRNLEQAVLDKRLGVLDAVKGLLISYSGLLIQMPDMFPQLEKYEKKMMEM
ncbi:hypothetical protein BDB00DRAFT_208774 [Zychaea mexicana]|uniref:uncharacterized protein n=1 Tax=Zychaea mexicana TaxID=64656 RepID=UPI0022FE91C9|nr:uncharacterized protein BDB00DRAFT_208774 [Zychaea mexicana]KAI9495650.1 hypothetical protein BDB00DRAFT_208774 [Zychaea mexicana]